MPEMANRHDLVSAARAGDGDAFMELVRIETPEAFRLTLAILRNPADAEDALQEAFVHAWRELPSLRDADRWSAWLRRLVVTAAMDVGRRKKTSRIVPLGLHEPPPAPESSAGLAERDEIMRAMCYLDADDRALLALRYVHDLELPDVAATLGIPLGTAKSRLHRALARIRKQLENDDGHREVSAREPGARVGPAPAKPWF